MIDTILPTTMPTRSWVQSEDFYQGLDPGIRYAVRLLHASGIETHQSCQGGPGHAYDRPTVDLPGTPWTANGFAALGALACLPVDGIDYHWSIYNGLPHECFWRVTFSCTLEHRADEKPMFVYGYQAQP